MAKKKAMSKKSFKKGWIKRSTNIVLYVKYFLIIFGVGSLALFCYHFFASSRPKEIPVLKGPSAPFKQKPATSAVPMLPQKSYVYHQIEKRKQQGAHIETLLEAEAPVPSAPTSDIAPPCIKEKPIEPKKPFVTPQKTPSPTSQPKSAVSFSAQKWKACFSSQGKYRLQFEQLPDISQASAQWKRISSCFPYPLPPAAKLFFKKKEKNQRQGWIILTGIASYADAQRLQAYLKQKGIAYVYIP